MKIKSINGLEKELNIFIKDLLIFVGHAVQLHPSAQET